MNKNRATPEYDTEGSVCRRRRVTASCRRAIRSQQRTTRPAHCPTGNHLPAPSAKCVTFSAPSSIPKDLLMYTTVVALIKHLLYVRGLLPMSIDQLFADDIDGEATKGLHGSVETSNNPYQSFTSPPLRRKQRKARSEIHRLLSEWSLMGAFLSNGYETQLCSGDQAVPESPKLAFIALSVGPSYTQCHELYLLDVKSIRGEDERTKTDDQTIIFNQERRRKLEDTLIRRLFTTILNHVETPFQELPARASSSFRLWVTLGVCNACTNKEETRLSARFLSTSQRMNELWHLLHSSTHGRTRNESFTPLIERRGVPVVRQHQSSSTCARIPQQNNHICIQLKRSANDSHNQSDDHLHFTSERLSWFSLPTSVKGFRLS
jgi:hypothetical protein